MDVELFAPIIQYMSHVIDQNTEYYIKVVSNINNSSGLWEVINSDQLLLVSSIERLFEVYSLFQNSNIDVDYIKVCGPKISLKIYTKSRRIVFSTIDDRLIPYVYTYAKQMNISNLSIVMNFK